MEFACNSHQAQALAAALVSKIIVNLHIAGTGEFLGFTCLDLVAHGFTWFCMVLPDGLGPAGPTGLCLANPGCPKPLAAWNLKMWKMEIMQGVEVARGGEMVGGGP